MRFRPGQLERKQPGMAARPQYAHFGRRAIAILLDIVLLTLVTSPLSGIILSIVAPGFTPTLSNLFANTQLLVITLVVLTTIQALYYGYFLSQNKGQTPGKKLLGIRVIKRDGSKLTVRDALLRNVIGYQLSHIIPGIGFLWMFVDKQSRTWHDMLTNTIVVDA